jgi:uncharacterized protein (TIGR02453 family)
MLEKSLSFLALLKENNYKEWYFDNKPLYEEAKLEFEVFVLQLIESINQFDKSIGRLQPKDCIFRIFRDVRFSKDKTPYKTNFGAVFAKGGKKSENGCYYFHLEPDNSLLAGGVWMPQPDLLKAIRNEIFHNINDFMSIISDAEFKKYFKNLDKDYVLVNAPKDFPKDWTHIEFLKLKSYTISSSIKPEILAGSSLVSHVQEIFKAMQPFNTFLNNVVADIRNN